MFCLNIAERESRQDNELYDQTSNNPAMEMDKTRCTLYEEPLRQLTCPIYRENPCYRTLKRVPGTQRPFLC